MLLEIDKYSIQAEKEKVNIARKKNDKSIHEANGCQSILLKELLLQPRALRKEVLREAIKRTGANVKKLTYRHWKDIDKCIKEMKTGSSLDLPDKVKISKDPTRINISKRYC